MDNQQNNNAVFIDQFSKNGKTSTKIINPPGGKDHFSLEWDSLEDHFPHQNKTQPQPSLGRKNLDQFYSKHSSQQTTQQPPSNPQQNNPHTSVKISQSPGGNSKIVLGK